MFIVTKTFTEGVLKGITIDDRSPVAFTVGESYGGGLLGSRYIVKGCRNA